MIDLNSAVITGTVRRKSPMSTSMVSLDVECRTLRKPKTVISCVFRIEAPTRLTVGIQPGDQVRIVGHLEDRGDINRIVLYAEVVEVKQ